MSKDPIIREAANAVGGVTVLSSELGLSRAAVSGWTRVPAERVLAVERITGMPRYRLRPDLYPLEAALGGVDPKYREQVAESLGIKQPTAMARTRKQQMG